MTQALSAQDKPVPEGQPRRSFSGLTSYEMRSEGIPFREIAALFRITERGAALAAQRYARRDGRPWPINQPIRESSRAGVISRATAYEMRKGGASWTVIAALFGVTERGTSLAAERYALSASLEWPIGSGKIPSENDGADQSGNHKWFEGDDGGDARKAYELRRSGVPWSEMCRQFGAGAQCTAKAARRYADLNQLDWPIHVPRPEVRVTIELVEDQDEQS